MKLIKPIKDFTALLIEVSFMPPNEDSNERKLNLRYIEDLYTRLFYFPIESIRDGLIAEGWTDEVLKNRLKTARLLLRDWITPDGIAQFETDDLLSTESESMKYVCSKLGVTDGGKYMLKVFTLFREANLNIHMVAKTLKEVENLITPQPDTPTEQEQTVSKLPPELGTPQAHIIWSKAKHNGWIDDNYQFIGTRQQMCFAADTMGKSLKLKYRWKPFEQLWNYKFFAQTRQKGELGYEPIDRMNELKTIFSL